MGSSRLIFYSPLLGPSGYPTDLVTGQPSAGKGRAQGYHLCHPPIGKIVVIAKIVVRINIMQETMARSTIASEHVSVVT